MSTLGSYEYCTKPETNLHIWAKATMRYKIDVEEQTEFTFGRFTDLDIKSNKIYHQEENKRRYLNINQTIS